MGATLIIGAALLAALALIALVVPLFTCPTCSGTGQYLIFEGFPEAPCSRCRQSGRVPFYQRYVARIFALEEPASPGKTPKP